MLLLMQTKPSPTNTHTLTRCRKNDINKNLCLASFNKKPGFNPQGMQLTNISRI